ncbi:hypothetical protein FBEOM_13792 [Fusarium beomiforme]|uniref:Uncharacterized protein n=1 Tax=Fusarium beomiforme TaxID=44412 RepID=A0A9P5DRS3_9HYPO|nr:hypothetical protein FBEOM_13792 [Fusarium beomiforme]
MFVYNGIIDQANSSLVEFVVVILPSRVEVGSPCIVLCLPGVHGSLPQNQSKYVQGPSAAVHSFEPAFETMAIAPDGKTATFTSAHCGLTVHIPQDMATLELSFHIDSEGPTLSSSMALAMHHPLLASKSANYNPTLFLGSVHLANQFQGYLVALVLSEKAQQGELTGSMNSCISWNAKTAATTKVTPAVGPGRLSHIEELEFEDQSQEGELGQADFTVNNHSHEFRGTVSQVAGGKHALELSLRSRHHHGLSGSKDWSLVTIPQLDKHNEALLQMISEFGSNDAIKIYNNSNDVVTCTIESSTAEWYGKGMSLAGLLLATLGLPGGPAMIAARAAVAGFFLALKSLQDTMWASDTSKSMVLYPNDKMEQAKSGWYTYYDIIMVRSLVESNGYKLSLTSYRLSRVTQNSYDVRNIPLDTSVKKQTIFEIPLQTRSSISNRRFLGIRGVRPDRDLDSYGTPGTLNEGDILSYKSDGTCEGTWSSYNAWDGAGYYFFRARGLSKDSQIAIVHGGSRDLGRSNNVHIYHLLQDPYSPVLCIQNAEIRSDATRLSDRRAIGNANSNDEVLKLIWENEQKTRNDYNWAYCKDYTNKVYAWKWTADNVVAKNNNRNTYFVFGPGS